MIDEHTLAGLLAEHAEAIPVPASAIAELLAASPDTRAASTTFRAARPSGRVLAAAAAVVVVAAGVWAVGSQVGGRATHASRTSSGPALLPTKAPPTSSVLHGLPARPPSNVSGYSSGATTVTPTGGGSVRQSTSPTRAAKPDGARVVRTGELTLKIARHRFGPTIGSITTTVAAEGGFISDQHTFESATTPSGTVQLRVPSAHFNGTMARLRKLGTVVSATTHGVDVTGQYTDLQARLRAATASRDQFLTVLSRATTIGDILAVQDRIQAVQTQVEQLQGQIRDLNGRTTYATITVAVSEPAPKPKAAIKPHHPSGLSQAWDNARDGFARRIESIISHSGSVLVILVGLLLLAFALKLFVPRVRRAFV